MIIIKNGMDDVTISSDPLPFLPLFVNIFGNHFPPDVIFEWSLNGENYLWNRKLKYFENILENILILILRSLKLYTPVKHLIYPNTTSDYITKDDFDGVQVIFF